jgi:methylthioribulose 1-phosphate dehydratase / enolase-phosphatase E1
LRRLFCVIHVLTSEWSTIQIEDDLQNGVAGAVPVPPDEGGKEEVINSLVANVESMIKADRKITSLKQLQVA